MGRTPDSKHDMLRAGYKFLNFAKCKSCDAKIEWWLTTNKRKIPFDPMPDNEHEVVTTHWATCPNANDHREPKRDAPASTSDAANYEYLAAFRTRSNARVIVAIYDNGAAAVWRNGLSGEDLRQELITQANKVRNYIVQENNKL